MPEEPYLYPFLSGREYLELIGRLREMPPSSMDRKMLQGATLIAAHITSTTAAATFGFVAVYTVRGARWTVAASEDWGRGAC